MAENNNTDPVEAEAAQPTEETCKTEANGKSIREKIFQGQNFFVGLFSIFTFILSLPILASVVWLLYMKSYDCEDLLKLPSFQVWIAIGMIFVFLISNAAVMLRSRFPAPAFLVVMVPLIVMFVVGLALVGADRFESRKIFATPMWFREKVRENNWPNIKSCIFTEQVCDDLASRSLAPQSYDFTMKTLSYVESGCCEPPKLCAMKSVNATFWTKDESLMEQPHPDCELWTNDRNILCYDCDSCKIGFVKIMESKWRKLGVFLIIMALFLMISHTLLFITVMWEIYNR